MRSQRISVEFRFLRLIKRQSYAKRPFSYPALLLSKKVKRKYWILNLNIFSNLFSDEQIDVGVLPGVHHGARTRLPHFLHDPSDADLEKMTFFFCTFFKFHRLRLLQLTNGNVDGDEDARSTEACEKWRRIFSETEFFNNRRFDDHAFVCIKSNFTKFYVKISQNDKKNFFYNFNFETLKRNKRKVNLFPYFIIFQNLFQHLHDSGREVAAREASRRWARSWRRRTDSDPPPNNGHCSTTGSADDRLAIWKMENQFYGGFLDFSAFRNISVGKGCFNVRS